VLLCGIVFKRLFLLLLLFSWAAAAAGETHPVANELCFLGAENLVLQERHEVHVLLALWPEPGVRVHLHRLGDFLHPMRRHLRFLELELHHVAERGCGVRRVVVHVAMLVSERLHLARHLKQHARRALYLLALPEHAANEDELVLCPSKADAAAPLVRVDEGTDVELDDRRRNFAVRERLRHGLPGRHRLLRLFEQRLLRYLVDRVVSRPEHFVILIALRVHALVERLGDEVAETRGYGPH